MKRFVKEYKGFRIYHDSDGQSVPQMPCWIVKGKTTYSLCGFVYTLADAEKFIDERLLGNASYDYALSNMEAVRNER